MSVPLLVVSPHLDDAVLSCGRLLASTPGSVVLTVLAGRPPDDRFVDWDRQGGFRPGDDVIGRRRAEDRRALRLLRARPIWLDFRDDVYRDGPLDAEAVRTEVTRVVDAVDPAQVVVPLGLLHPDHVAVADAVRDALPGRPVRLYAERPYATTFPDTVPPRLGLVPGARLVPGPARGRWRKVLAICSYRSQVRALGRGVLRSAGLVGETYWEIPGGTARA